MILTGVVRRQVVETQRQDNLNISDINDLGPIDVGFYAFLPASLRKCIKLLTRGINTIDSTDIHGDLVDLKKIGSYNKKTGRIRCGNG